MNYTHPKLTTSGLNYIYPHPLKKYTHYAQHFTSPSNLLPQCIRLQSQKHNLNTHIITMKGAFSKNDISPIKSLFVVKMCLTDSISLSITQNHVYLR